MRQNIYLIILSVAVIAPNITKGQWSTNGLNINNTNSGNVGIGTNNPISKLNVQSDELQLQLTGASDLNKRLRLGYNTIDNYGSIQALRYGKSFDNLNINPDGGNVGIGTVSPTAKLHINAPLTDAAIKIGSPNDAGNVNVPIGASTGGYNVDFYTWRDIFGDQIGARIRAERINTYQPNNAMVQAMELGFYTSNGLGPSELSEKMRINSSGNVGIGTKDTKGYKLAVAGNVIAESMKVQLQSAWSDFVFAKDYVLPTLKETEKHIKENGHLQGIPSAKEVKANGIDLGDMNAKLLQKIEELTLHLIDQNKRFDVLEKKNEQQEKEIKKLKSKIK